MSALRVGLPSTPSVVGMLTQEALSFVEALCSSSPSDTHTLRATRALAWSATFSAAAVVTTGTASTNFTVAVAEDRSRAASATTSWKLSGAMVWPTTAGVTTKDFLSAASFTLASRPALSAWPTRPATTVAVWAGSVSTTASTPRGATSDFAYDDQVLLATNTASTVASTSTA